MRTDLYWIPLDTPGKLAIMPRPRGGDWLEDELSALAWSGVGVVVCLLTPLRAGTNVAIHCRIGIGRSAVIAGCVLVCLGASAEEAFETIGSARGQIVPDTDQQRAWLESFARRHRGSAPASPSA